MKKIFSLIVTLFLFVSCFAQSTKNINSQPNIRPVNTTRFSALDGNGLIKNVRFDEMKDSIQAPLNVQIGLKANQTAVDNSVFQLQNDIASEAAARVAGDASLMPKKALIDSLVFRGKNVVKSTTNFESYVIGNIKYTTPIGAFSNSSTTYGSRYIQGINADSAISNFNSSDYSIQSFWTDNTPVQFSFYRKNYSNNLNWKGNGAASATTNGHFSVNMSNLKNSVDSVQQAGIYLGIANSYGDQKTIGNGAGVEIYKRHLNVFTHTGLHFYNQMHQDSIYWVRNPQKGHLISIRDEGALYVKEQNGNTIGAYSKVVTQSQLKKTYTVQINSIGATMAVGVGSMGMIPTEAIGGKITKIDLYYYTPSASASDICNYNIVQVEGGSYSTAVANIDGSTGRFVSISPNLTISSNSVFSFLINSVSGNTSGRLTATFTIEK